MGLAISFNTILDIKSVFEFSCGLGTNLLAFKKLGYAIQGTEFQYMLKNILPDIKQYVFDADITVTLEHNIKYDLVLCTAILEHIEEKKLQTAIENLKKLRRKYIAVTVPIINPGYESCANHIKWEGSTDNWARKLEEKELWKNEDGTAVMGHITMATEKWWEDLFEVNGLHRDKKLEFLIMKEFEKAGIATFYTLFLLRPIIDEEVDTILNHSESLVEKEIIQKSKNLNYSTSLILEDIELKKFVVHPGQLFFITIRVINLSNRKFQCHGNPKINKNYIRIGVRFSGVLQTQNLPAYLHKNELAVKEECLVSFQIKAPYNSGNYLCEISLVEEGITWFIDADPKENNRIIFSLFVS